MNHQLVGAYESGNAVYLKSAPVVQMESRVSYRSRAGNQINLERKDCTLRDGRSRVPCVDVEVFMKYDGEGVPDRLGKFVQLYLYRIQGQYR